MLPDIARPNKLLHVSGLGQYAGGVLSRTNTDLHPDEFEHSVVWNGTIACQQQKAEQRRPGSVMPPTVKRDKSAIPVLTKQAERILDTFERTAGPLSAQIVAKAAQVELRLTRRWLRVLAEWGMLASAVLPNPHAGIHGQRNFVRMYAAPKEKAA